MAVGCGREILVDTLAILGRDSSIDIGKLAYDSEAAELIPLVKQCLCRSSLAVIWTCCVSAIDVRRMHNFVRGGSSSKQRLASV